MMLYYAQEIVVGPLQQGEFPFRRGLQLRSSHKVDRLNQQSVGWGGIIGQARRGKQAKHKGNDKSMTGVDKVHRTPFWHQGTLM